MSICYARYVKYAPKKVERVLDIIRSKSVDEAEHILLLGKQSCCVAVQRHSSLRFQIIRVQLIIKISKSLKHLCVKDLC